MQNKNNKIKIGIICLEKDDFYSKIEHDFKEISIENNVELISMTPDCFNVNSQVQGMLELINMKVNGIVLVPSDSDILRPVVENAVEQGIKIVCLDNDIHNSGRHIFISSDHHYSGKTAAMITAGMMNGKADLAVMICASEMESVKNRYHGFVSELLKYPSMRIVKKECISNTDLELTKVTLVELLEDCQSEAIFLPTASSAVIAADIIKDIHADTKIICISGTEKTSKEIMNSGITACVMQHTECWASLAFDGLYKLIRGEKVQDYIDTGIYILNQDNYAILKS
jgi:ABC-type sugar transport system, periplasmic component